jgi:hypothetical protein
MTASVGAAVTQKFDPARAAEFEKQSRIALAGYDACHELAACMLTAVLGSGTTARVLVFAIPSSQLPIRINRRRNYASSQEVLGQSSPAGSSSK